VFLATGAVVIVAEGVILFPSTIVHEVDTHAIVLQTLIWRLDAHVFLAAGAIFIATQFFLRVADTGIPIRNANSVEVFTVVVSL